MLTTSLAFFLSSGVGCNNERASYKIKNLNAYSLKHMKTGIKLIVSETSF